MLLVCGIYTSNRELNGSLRGLWTSAWGRILVAKVTLALLALGLGALNRFTLKRPPTAGGLELLAARLRMEATVMVLILCLSGLLASTAPPMAQDGSISESTSFI
jgi:putative copper export protein